MKYLYNAFFSLLLLIPNLAAASEDNSLYDVPFQWRDQNGAEFNLDSLKDKTVILTMAYTKCKTACPLMMQRLKKIDAELEGKVKEPHFVVVSLDPQSDSSEKMAEFEKQYKLDGKRWHLLTGRDADVRRLSVYLSYSYQKLPQPAENQPPPKDEIVHSNKIYALSPKGEIAAELEGLTSELKPFISALPVSAKE